MARNFSTNSNFLSRGAAITEIQTAPFTISGWAMQTTISTSPNIIVSNEFNAANRWGLYVSASGQGSFLVFEARGGAVSNFANTGVAPGTGTWFHALGAEANTTMRWCRYNGDTRATNGGTDAKGTPPDDMLIGTSVGIAGSPGITLAEIGVWNTTLTEEEEWALSRGFSPRFIRPQSLVLYLPIMGNQSPEPDRSKNGYNFTVNGTPTQAVHVPIIHPTGPMVVQKNT